jgi:diphthine-ammonia ligase
MNSTEVEDVIHSDHDFATVAFLRIKNANLESKTPSEIVDVPVPSLLEEDFQAVRDAIAQSQENTSVDKVLGKTGQTDVVESIGGVQIRRIDPWISVANIQRDSSNLTDISVEDEVNECFTILRGQLQPPYLLCTDLTCTQNA